MKRALVTGATGFLGQRLAFKLQEMGVQVLATGRNLEKAKPLIKNGIEFLALDLEDNVQVKSLKLDVDWVFHCAALSSPWGAYQDFYKANVLATENLLSHFSVAPLEKFVYVSSPSVYTSLTSRLNIKESEPLPKINLNHYIATKKIAEGLVDKYSAAGLKIVTLRPQGLIGAGDPSIFPRILKSARKGMLPKIGKGVTLLDLTYVDNVVHGLICAAKADARSHSQKYNISNGEPVELYSTIQWLLDELKISFRWKELSTERAIFLGTILENIYRLMPSQYEPPLSRYTVCTFAYDRTLDITKARTELNYAPQVSVKEGLNKVLRYYKDIKNA